MAVHAHAKGYRKQQKSGRAYLLAGHDKLRPSARAALSLVPSPFLSHDFFLGGAGHETSTTCGLLRVPGHMHLWKIL